MGINISREKVYLFYFPLAIFFEGRERAGSNFPFLKGLGFRRGPGLRGPAGTVDILCIRLCEERLWGL